MTRLLLLRTEVSEVIKIIQFNNSFMINRNSGDIYVAMENILKAIFALEKEISGI